MRVSGTSRVKAEIGLLERVFDDLHAAGIRYCVLRDGESLDPDSSGEIDLLVDPEKLPALHELLAETGFVAQPSWGHAPHHFFIGYDAARDAWLKLDVVDRLAFGSPVRALDTALAHACLTRRRHRGFCFVPSPEDEFMGLLLHCVLDKGCFAPVRRDRLKKLCSEVVDESYLSMLLEEYWSPATTRPRLADLIQADEWAVILSQRGTVERRLRQRDPLGSQARHVRGRVLRKLNRWLRPGARRAPSIALLAPDGAGKSTLTQRIQETVPVPVQGIYMGLYPQHEKAPRLPGLGFPRRLLRQWLRYLHARWHQARGRFVIFDRYGYDALLPTRRRLPWYRRLRRGILGRACPPPDFVVVLDAPGEVLYARKGEHDPAALEEQRRGYRQLASGLSGSVVIDVTQPLETVCREITALLWRAYVTSDAGGARP
jgi:thymidylate kinase